MNTQQQQWIAQSSTLSQRGWMLSPKAPHSAGRTTRFKDSYPQTLKARQGWGLSSTSSTHQAKTLPVVLSKTSEALAINCHKLSAQLADGLAEKNLDWVSLLTNDWPLEIFNTTLLGVENFQSKWFSRVAYVETLVQLTLEANYYPVTIADQSYWSYTCCLQLAELGRVRFLVYVPDSEHCGKYAALLTNRLDWSPRKIISQYLQLPIWPKLLESPVPLSITKRPALQLL